MNKLSLSLTFLVILALSIVAIPQTLFVEAQDFGISVTPGIQSHYGPGNVTYYVTVSSSGGFHEQVVLTATISGAGADLPNPQVHPILVTPPPNGVAHAVIVVWIKNPSGSGVVGSHTITVTGSSGGVSHVYTVTLSIASGEGDFSLYSNVWFMTIHPGVPATYTLKVFAVGDVAPGDVSLYAYGGPRTGYFNFTYASVAVNVAGGIVRNLTFTVTPTSADEPGSYPITISGTSSVTHNYYVILIVEATGDFTIEASQDTLSVNQGESASVTITITSISGFASKTILKWEWVGTKPTGVTPSLSPSYVTPTSGGSKDSTLKIETTSSATLGTFEIMVTGTSYPKVHNVNVTVEIKSIATFTVQASPASRSVYPGQSAEYTVTVATTGGYNKRIMFTLNPAPPSGISYSFSPPEVTPPSVTTSTLTVYTTSTVPTGTYALTIQGAGDGTTDTHQVTLTVSEKTSSAISLSLDKSSIKVGENVRLSGRISPNPGSGQAVEIEYSLDGSAWSTVTTADTDSNGEYTYTWTPPSKGSYRFRSSWEGSIAYNGDTSGEQTLTVETTPTGPPLCIIATATYGSELAPEVQFLRSFRDQQVKSTFAGNQFMVAFDAWYYSFSPYVAQFISGNTFARAIMKVLLYPLIGILHLASMTYNAFGFSQEIAVAIAGLVASALIGVVYFSPLAILALVLLRRYRKTTFKMSQLRMPAIVWVTSLLMIIVGEVALLAPLLIASTALFVLSTLSLGALTVATALLRRIQ